MFKRLIHWVRKKMGLPYEGDLRVISSEAPWSGTSKGTVFVVLRQSQRFSTAHHFSDSGWEVQMQGRGMVVWMSDSMIARMSKSVGI